MHDTQIALSKNIFGVVNYNTYETTNEYIHIKNSQDDIH